MTGFKNEIGSFEAKTHLAKLLRETEQGRSFVIRRRGKAVARLVPAKPEDKPPDFAQLLSWFRALRKQLRRKVSVRALIEEGRRF